MSPHDSAPSSRRHSRRSTGGSINFLQMSVSPLTTASLTEHDFAHKQPRRSASYIQGISVRRPAPRPPRARAR